MNHRVLIASVLLGAMLVGCEESQVGPATAPAAAVGERPHIVLIVIDTLRADHVGSYGYERPTTPTLDALAAEGVLFTNALSTSSWTKPAVASLFTSRFPSEHGAVAFDRHLKPAVPTLAELLGQAGYLTVGVSANFVHVAKHSGLARGFEKWRSLSVKTSPENGDSFWQEEVGEGETRHFRPAHAEEVNRALLKLLPKEIDRPLFLYVHYMEPHSDYAPPETLRQRFERAPTPRFAGKPVTSDDLIALAKGESRLSDAETQHAIDLYDAEIAAADAGVAALLSALEARGLDEPLLVVTSDHGEEFGEHDGWFHAMTLYRESLAVPLVFRDPSREGGERRDDPVTLMDVAPTLLARVGVTRPKDMHGHALFSGEVLPQPRGLVAELHPDPHFEEHVLPRRQRLTVQRGPWKILIERDGNTRSYQLDRDPSEQQPLGMGGNGAPAPLFRAAQQLFVVLDRQSAEATATALTTGEVDGLRALGYLGSDDALSAEETGEAEETGD